MPTASDVEVLLGDFERLARAEGLRWYLFGAQAVVLHGRPRLTEDVDITLEIARPSLPDFVRRASEAGFELRVQEDPEGFVEATSVLPMRHSPTGLDLDVVLAGSGLEGQFLDRATVSRMGSARVPVIDASDLVVAKILAGRAKDLDDADGIVACQGDALDLARIRALLRELQEALSISDLLPAFDRCLVRGRRAPGG